MRVIEGNALATADPARGRLRTYLLAVFQNQAADECRKRTAKKRGGGIQHLPLDHSWAEHRLSIETDAPDALEPQRALDRRWALLMLERVLHSLEAERSSSGCEGEWGILSPFLDFSTGGNASYKRAAESLGLTVNATRVKVFRLRRRFRELLMETVADTLEDPTAESVCDEIRELLVALD